VHSRAGCGRSVGCLVVLVAALLVVGSTPGAGASTGTSHATRTSQIASPKPLPTTYAPARLILTDTYDATDPYMLTVGNRNYLYTSEGATYLNVPLWIGTKSDHWGPLIDAMPTLPAWAEGGLTWAPDVQKVAG